MKYFFICILFLFLGCSKTEKQNISFKTNEYREEKRIAYSDFLSQIYSKSEIEKKKEFFRYINNDIPYYWQKTLWSFDGTSREPQKGSIACGYFVTNILTDYGFEIKRAYLAQQPSSVMIKELCTNIHYFSKRDDLEKYILEKEKNQVYLVGLDFHTGFITRENKDTYFIHSNYIKNEGVIKEKTSTSAALNASKTFMIGNLKF